MVTSALLPLIVGLLDIRKNRLLQAAQIGLPANQQYDAYRKFLLDELGRNGFERDLEEVLTQYHERTDTGRNIHAGKEVQK